MRALALILWLLWPALASGQTAAEFERALRLPELAQVLAEEAARAGREIDLAVLAGQGGGVFADQVSQLNTPARLSSEVATGVVEAMPKQAARNVLKFFDTSLGQRAIGLELNARQAFLDPEIEDYARSEAANSPYATQIAKLIDGGDMIARNRLTVERTTATFYLGLRRGGALDLSDAEVNALANEQAAASEADTRAWLEGFFALAYSPLDPADMNLLVAFWDTPDAKAFSVALYEALDAAYVDRWFGMGQAAALFMVADDI